jgi:hypothetical protein
VNSGDPDGILIAFHPLLIILILTTRLPAEPDQQFLRGIAMLLFHPVQYFGQVIQVGQDALSIHPFHEMRSETVKTQEG